jgi:hypothetical protein
LGEITSKNSKPMQTEVCKYDKNGFFYFEFCPLQGSICIHSTFIKIWNIIKLCMWLEKHIFRKKKYFLACTQTCYEKYQFFCGKPKIANNEVN